MSIINSIIPLISFLLSVTASVFVLRRYAAKRGSHLLLWGIGLIMYGIGGFCEAFYGAFGWSPLIFKLWYLFGAILVAAWLGQGTVYLLMKKRPAHILQTSVNPDFSPKLNALKKDEIHTTIENKRTPC